MDKDRHTTWLSAWDLLAAAGLSALALFYTWALSRLPDPVPTHFDAQGRVNGWTAQAYLPWLIFGVPALLWLLLWVIGGIASRVAKASAKTSAAVVEPLRGFLGLGMCLLVIGCLAAPLRGVVAIQVGAAVFFLCLLLGIVFMALEAKHFLSKQSVAAHYRGGLFYVNPEDPRLWVEKRLGVGWTLNYAQRAAWWVSALLLLPVLAVLGLVVVLRQ